MLDLTASGICKCVSSESIWILRQALKYFCHAFHGTLPHHGGSNFLLTVQCAAVATNLNKLGMSFNLSIGCCFDNGYVSGMVQLWESKQCWWSQNVQTRCVRLVSASERPTVIYCTLYSYLPASVWSFNRIKSNASPSYVLNLGSSLYNHPIFVCAFYWGSWFPLFMKIMGRQVYRILKAKEPWAFINLHFHMHVPLGSFDDFPQLFAASLQELGK